MDRGEILRKLAGGELSVEEATRLIQEGTSEPAAAPVESTEPATPENAPAPVKKSGTRWLHVRISDLHSQHDQLRVNVPLGLVRTGLKIGARFTDRIAPDAWSEVLEALDNGEIGTLVEVEDIDKGERVHIYVD
jgi:hypothetical protein